MDTKQLEKIMVEVEKFFETKNDLTQAPASVEGFKNIERLHPAAVQCSFDGDTIVSVALSIPTSKVLAEKFLNGDITERELLSLTKPMKKYEALYFHLAFTLPEYRGKGLTAQMFARAAQEIPCIEDVIFLAWPFSDAGEHVLKKIEKETGAVIRRKQHVLS